MFRQMISEVIAFSNFLDQFRDPISRCLEIASSQVLRVPCPPCRGSANLIIDHNSVEHFPK